MIILKPQLRKVAGIKTKSRWNDGSKPRWGYYSITEFNCYPMEMSKFCRLDWTTQTMWLQKLILKESDVFLILSYLKSEEYKILTKKA